MKLYFFLALNLIAMLFSGCDKTNHSQDSSSNFNTTAIGFYDFTANGKARPIRNDLTGNLEAMVQFGQNLTLDPKNNEAHNMPRLVSQRSALLLVTPKKNVQQLTLEVQVNGEFKGQLKLNHPQLIPSADHTAADSRPAIVYSNRAWNTVLPWDWMVPGLELTLSDENNHQGTLYASDIEFGVPGQLLINNIQVGLLTAYPTKEKYWNADPRMLNFPADSAADYLQIIPAAELIMAAYEPLKLDKVMVASGEIYTDRSPDTGGVHSGDMRENVGKSTFAVGINLANWGITSAGMADQSQPQLTQQLLVHHIAGKYAHGGDENGDVFHGLSGGNGMLTLTKSAGNEMSHEAGHHYGMGDYYGKTDQQDGHGEDYWSHGHLDSGWGYIAYRQRMRANIAWNRTDTQGYPKSQVFKDQYVFEFSPMNSGSPSSSLSNYTMYTGFETKTKIQPAFDRYQYSCDYRTNQVTGTGFIKWNAAKQQMESVAAPAAPAQRGTVWYGVNKAVGQFNPDHFPVPRLCGVPVFTILGGYDPETDKAVIYPAARSNFGHVFDRGPSGARTHAMATALSGPQFSPVNQQQCWLEVSFTSGLNEKIAVAPRRMSGSTEYPANKFALNLAQEDAPKTVALYCQKSTGSTRKLGEITIPQGLTPMPAAIFVGKEHGYKALMQAELPELISALTALEPQFIPLLTERAQFLLDSWRNQLTAELLGADAYTQLQRHDELFLHLEELENWISSHQNALKQGEQVPELQQKIQRLGLASAHGSSLLPPSSAMTVGNDSCLNADLKTLSISSYGAKEPQCTEAEFTATRSWVTDALGRIHNAADPTLCIQASNPIKLGTCQLSAAEQRWNLADLPLIKAAQNGKCLDMSGGALADLGQKDIILYGCGGGKNQQWHAVNQATEHYLLALLSPTSLSILAQLDAL